MGTIKFEIDLPEFNKELNISLTIRKDGEVIYTTSSSSTDVNSSSELKKENNDFTNTVQKNITGESSMNSFESQGIMEKATKSPKSSTTTKKKSFGGNMMNMDI